MIVSGFNTCAKALFGLILDCYGTVGRFGGHLGCPSTDITHVDTPTLQQDTSA